MSTGIVADKYSTAIFELAQEQNILLQVEEDLLYVQQVMKDSAEFSLVLTHPVMEETMKIDLVKKIFGNAISKTALNFINVMIHRGRAAYLDTSISGFVSKSREARGIIEADVIVTEPLSKEAQQKLIERLQRILQKEVMLNVRVNPQIMGGMIIQIGDKRIDASVARRLEELEKSLRRADSTEIGVNS